MITGKTHHGTPKKISFYNKTVAIIGPAEHIQTLKQKQYIDEEWEWQIAESVYRDIYLK